MNIPLIVALVLGFSAVDDEIRGQILNGMEARSDQFKYMAVVIPKETRYFGIVSTKYRCGGTIIAPNWVLTAAHCLYHASTAKVYLGTLTMDDAEKIYKLKQNAFIVHPDFNFATKLNDIALIQIPRTEVCERISFAHLPFKWFDQDVLTERIGVIMGWGKPDDYTSTINNLQWTEISIISNDECQKFKIPTDTQLCGNTRRLDASLCFGDSGGPLLSKKTGEQIGIISYLKGKNCALGQPLILTRITTYLAWISEVTGMSA